MLNAIAAASVDRWGHVEELLATVAELLDALLHLQAKAHFKNPRLPKPLRVRRPGEPDTPKLSMGQMARKLMRR